MIKDEEGMIINTNRIERVELGEEAYLHGTVQIIGILSVLAFPPWMNMRRQGKRSVQVRSEVFTVCQHNDCLFT